MTVHYCFLMILICINLSIQSTAYNEFPKNFLFGTATSSYQIEGAWNLNGKGVNIWDRYTHDHPELILDGSNGDIACDSYHKVEEDVELIKNLGSNFYRFSLSWSRILPQGLAYKINSDGIRYYNKLINLLIENGIEPTITLFHWDTPQPLEDLGGFSNELMVNWFSDYARIAFEHFGDRVKWWLTFNEPRQICLLGYGDIDKAPGYNSSGVGDYLCIHNLLKAHAAAYHIYDKEFRPTQNGKIGITLDTEWYYPKTQTKQDIDAADRTLQFCLAYQADPIYHPKGDYPEVVKKFIGQRSQKEGFKQSRLPAFTEDEIAKLRGSADFLGLNHYTSRLVENVPEEPYDVPSVIKDFRVKVSVNSSWPGGSIYKFKTVPDGFKNLLVWIKNRYGNIDIYITENGFLDFGELNDQGRINYMKLYLSALLEAMYDYNVNVKSYTAWSLLDNFEWRHGYVHRFGLHHVNFTDPTRKRTPKASVEFLKSVFKNKKINAF